MILEEGPRLSPFIAEEDLWAMTNLVTAKELGQYLKLSESTVYKLASVGKLPGFKIGDSWRFDREEILKLIREANNKALKKRKI